MTQLAGALTWQESQVYEGPVAIYTAALATDPQWIWPLDGFYQQHRIRPNYCTVDNLASAQEVAVNFGPVRFVIEEFSRLTFAVPDQAQTVIVQWLAGTAAPVIVTFSIADISRGDTSNVYAIRGATEGGALRGGVPSPLITAGVQIIGALRWQETQAYQGPVSLNTADLGAYGTWIWRLDGMYQQAVIRPKGITVDNLTNAQQCQVSFGPVNFTVNQYSRMTFAIPESAVSVQLQAIGAAASPVGVTFAIADLSKGDTTNLYAIQQSIAANYVLKSGDTMTGNLTIAPASGNAIITLNAPASQYAAVYANNPARSWYFGNAPDGHFTIADQTAVQERLAISTAGNVTIDSGSLTIPNGGISLGSALAPGGPTDLSQHIALYATTYGFSVTAGTLNLVSNNVAIITATSTGATIAGALNVNTSATFLAAQHSGTYIGWSSPNVIFSMQSGYYWQWSSSNGALQWVGNNAVGFTIDAQGNATVAAVLYAATGNFSGNAVYISGTNPQFYMTSNGVRQWRLLANSDGQFYLTDMGANIHAFYVSAASGQVNFPYAVSVSGAVTAGSGVVAIGYRCRAGTNGAYGGSNFNFMWTTVLQAWVDGSNLGTVAFTSDYRIKRDIAPLPSMWDKVKALKPISYRHKDYTPPIEGARQLVFADDIVRWGFVAHELQEALIEDAATGSKDAEDYIQSPNVMTILATVTRGLQEAMTRIEALEMKC